jgi:ParB family chromosome partitioning protein
VQRRDILAINLASNPAIALDYHDLRDCRCPFAYVQRAGVMAPRSGHPSPSLYLANYPESPAHIR